MLPARIPNLLVNGATGIAVGMATNIPPHNLGEVCTALIKLLDNPDLTAAQLCRYVKGPDFPTGGQILNSRRRAEGDLPDRQRQRSACAPPGKPGRSAAADEDDLHHQHSRTRSTSRRWSSASPTSCWRASCRSWSTCKDLSTDDVRIALELKRDADEKMVMAYLFKHTPLQTNFAVNLTCLIPTENAEVGRPERLDLKQMLWHFLHFRLEVVTRRLEHELARCRSASTSSKASRRSSTRSTRSSRIIRKSDGKADAAEKIMKRFALDAEQTDAILELKLYRLARLEILVIQNELAEKRARTRADRRAAAGRRRAAGRSCARSSKQVQKTYGDKRRTRDRTGRRDRVRAPTTSSSTKTTSSSCRATAG